MRKTFALLAAIVGATVVSLGVSRAGESLVDPLDGERDCCSDAQIDQLGSSSLTRGDQLDVTVPAAPRFSGTALNPGPRPSTAQMPPQSELDAEPLVPGFNDKKTTIP